MSKLRKIVCSFLVLIGVIIAFLPQISNYIFTRQTDVIVKQYGSNITDDDIEKIWNEAVEWNKIVNNAANVQRRSSDLKKYQEQLNVDGIMGYISIPNISVQLPIYHGTSENVLSKGIGHLKKSSLPVGGVGTHCVLTGHTGLPTAELFNDVVKLEVGNMFYLTVAGHVLTYEIDNIATVLPDEADLLQSELGKDYCTLVTCTPYGVNTHRLLIRGIRVDDKSNATSYYINDKKDYKMLVAITILLLLIIITFLLWRKYASKKISL